MDAQCAVLFFTRGRDVIIGPEFVRDSAPAVALQVAFDTVALAWATARHRASLAAGRHLRLHKAALWPLYEDGHMAGIVYVDAVPAGQDFPTDRQRLYFQRIHNHARRAEVPHPVRSYVDEMLIETDVRGELERMQLERALRDYWGNVSAVARRLRVSRETVYVRMQRSGLKAAPFRKPRLGPAPTIA